MPDHDLVDERIRRAWAASTPDDGVHPTLPESAWERVARETGVADGATPDDTDAAAPTGPVAPVRAGRRWRPLLLVAAAVLVVAGLAVAARGLVRSSDGAELAAEAVLTSEGLPGAAPASGRAELLRVDDHRVLEVDLPDVQPADGTVLEVWLIDPESMGLRSLGTVDGRTRLPVPDAIDVDRFSVVDVSIEPLDGDPGHSSDSVVRGPLSPT